MGSQTTKPVDQQPLLDDTDEEPLIEKISIVLMGRHGVGKNTVGNAILKKKAFTFQDSYKSCYLKDENTTFDRRVSVTRVPGWSADLNSEKNRQLWQVIKDSVRSVDHGPHAIILVVDMSTEPAETTKEKLKQLLGDNVFQHILIISVDARKIVVNHSARKQTIINRCKYHFWSCTCGKQNKKIMETIEDFIAYKHDVRFYSMRNKAPNPALQYQDLANLVDGLKRKISALSDSLDYNMTVIESKNAEIRELQRLLKEKEDMLRAKEKEIERIKSDENDKGFSVSHKKTEQLQHATEQRKMEEAFQRKIWEMEKKLEEKNKQIEKLKLKSTEEIDKLKSESSEDIKKLRKEIQALKSHNGNKKKTKPSSMIGQSWKGANSIELISVTSAEASLNSEALQASEVNRVVQFLKKNRKELTERIVAVKPIADELLQFIGHHKYEKILQTQPEYEQRRELYDIIDKGGKKLKMEFYKSLLKHEKYLVEDLEESP